MWQGLGVALLCALCAAMAGLLWYGCRACIAKPLGEQPRGCCVGMWVSG